MSALLIFISIAILSEASSFGSNDYYYDNWCNNINGALEFLDDAKCVKKFPTNFDRDFMCPVLFPNSGLGYNLDVTEDKIVTDKTALSGIATAHNVSIEVIMIRRTQSDVYYKYMTDGESYWTPWETWSVSKIFALANAAGKLREVCNYVMGLDATTTSPFDPETPLGDLATIISSYDHQYYTSNSLAAYFHDVGTHDRIYDLVRGDFMSRADTIEELGGNYGESVPVSLGYTYKLLGQPELVQLLEEGTKRLER